MKKLWQKSKTEITIRYYKYNIAVSMQSEKAF